MENKDLDYIIGLLERLQGYNINGIDYVRLTDVEYILKGNLDKYIKE